MQTLFVETDIYIMNSSKYITRESGVRLTCTALKRVDSLKNVYIHNEG